MSRERKRRRMDGDADSGDDAKKQRVPDVQAVLPDELLQPVPLVECHVGVIEHPRFTSKLIRALNDVHPIPSLQHLKRVRRQDGTFEVLLATVGEFSGAQCLEALRARGLDAEGLSGETRVVAVPAVAPKTRAQFAAANAAWSCNFHEDAPLEKLLAGAMFSDGELERHSRWMREALRRGVGAVVVDPARDAMVAMATDSRKDHPLRHAVMNVVDLVARSQLGGAWDVVDGDVFDGDLPDRPPPVGTVRNRAPGEGDDAEGKPVGPYLCTGYDVYLSREPCTMCAMALVHSRVRRVFYASPSPHGILGTREKLHAIRALNHHYQVFRGSLGADPDPEPDLVLAQDVIVKD